jgi:hypothetical protein
MRNCKQENQKRWDLLKDQYVRVFREKIPKNDGNWNAVGLYELGPGVQVKNQWPPPVNTATNYINSNVFRE